jgi:hypothetical protein
MGQGNGIAISGDTGICYSSKMTTHRAWIILKDGKPLWSTVRRTRPESWEAWERAERPTPGFTYDVQACRIRVQIEPR